MDEPETLFVGRRFRIVRQNYHSADGQLHVRETVVHPGAVTILPLVDVDHVCLIRNFRPSVNQTLIELPAGTLEPGEDPREAARRELEEETGYSAETIEPLHPFFMSPGILNERMHMYVASGLKAGAPRRESGEQIDNLVVRWDEALAMALDGRIQDAKTLVGLLAYEVRRQQAGP